MAKIREEKKEERKDMPILFFFGLGLSGLLIWLLNKKAAGVSATLNGVLDSDGGAETKVSFEYGTEEGIWTESPRTIASAATEFSLVVPNLLAANTYLFRARAENEAGITWGEVLTFET